VCTHGASVVANVMTTLKYSGMGVRRDAKW